MSSFLDQSQSKEINSFSGRAQNRIARRLLLRPIDDPTGLKVASLAKTSRSVNPTVSVTIDHLDAIKDGKESKANALTLAKIFVSKGIPVTVFVSCQGGVGRCHKFDIALMKNLHALNPVKGKMLLELGIHTLAFGTSIKNQNANNTNLMETIKKITGYYPRVASYHGKNIEPGKIPKSETIQYTRGTGTTVGLGKHNTSTNRLKIEHLYNDVVNNWVNFFSSTFFFHPNQIDEDKVFRDALIDQIIKPKPSKYKQYEAKLYFDAMRNNY